jgi:predicted  nucleic acid-binding Zn-ribbon protein
MAIHEMFEKLITEHGSAAVLRERLEFAAEKFAALERKAEELAVEVASLREKNLDLQKEKQRLEAELEDLKKKSQAGVEVVHIRSGRDRFAGL